MASVLRLGPVVRQLQTRLDYKFRDVGLLWMAVQAPGAVLRSGEAVGDATERHSVGFVRIPDGNRRLAILGDTVLKLALVEDWYEGSESRERVSRVVADVGSNTNLEVIGRRHGIESFINKNPAQIDEAVSPVTIAATVEAILGAIYLDSDMKSVCKVMQHIGLMPRLIRKLKT